MNRTPKASSGMILPSRCSGWRCTPSMRGRLGPYMSPSSRPTFAPVRASAMARLAATVDFPTPPLPAPTAMTCATPGSARRSAVGSLGLRMREVVVSLTVLTPGTAMTARARVLLDLPLERAGRGGEHQGEGDLAVLDHEILDHAQGHEVAAQIGVLHGAQGVQDVFGAGVRHVAGGSPSRRGG